MSIADSLRSGQLDPPATAPLHVVETDPLGRAEAAVAELLSAFGRDVTSEHLRETPRRVAQSFAELLTPEPFTLTTFPNDEGYTDLVTVSGIPFTSLCEHHLLPFTGTARIGYLPGPRLVGLSKLARVLDHFARDLQVQERLTSQVAQHLAEELEARGVGVAISAEHTCMSVRGAKATGAMTTTSTFLGALERDADLRARFLAA